MGGRIERRVVADLLRRSAEDRPPAVAVDVDGTILDYDPDAFPELGVPKPGSVEALSELRGMGYLIRLHTCRLTGDGVDPEVEANRIAEHLTAHGVPFDEIVMPGEGKPHADYYVDDKGLRFDGDWGKVVSFVKGDRAARMTDGLVTEWQLAHGWTPAGILKAHYRGMERRARTASEGSDARAARVAVSLGGVTSFVMDLARTTGLGVADLVTLLKDSRAARLFGAVGWSMKKLYGILRKGYDAYRSLLDAIAEYVSRTRVAKWTTEELRKLDEWLQEHPRTKRLAGVALAAMIVYIWFNMSFTGDFKWDFDLSSAISALSGGVSWSQVFGGVEGTKTLMAFVIKMATGATFPWPGPDSAKFVAAVLFTVAAAVGKRLKRVKAPVEEQAEAIGIA
jgi:hypothetical protein